MKSKMNQLGSTFDPPPQAYGLLRGLMLAAILLAGLAILPLKARANSLAAPSKTDNTTQFSMLAERQLTGWDNEAFKSKAGAIVQNPEARLLLDYANRKLGFNAGGTKPAGFDWVATWQNRDLMLKPGRGIDAGLGYAGTLQLISGAKTTKRLVQNYEFALRDAPNGATASLIASVDQNTGFMALTLSYIPPGSDLSGRLEYRVWDSKIVCADGSKLQLFQLQAAVVALSATKATCLENTLSPMLAAGSDFASAGVFLLGKSGPVGRLHLAAGAYDAQFRDTPWWKAAVGADAKLVDLREGVKDALGRATADLKDELPTWLSKGIKLGERVVKFLGVLKAALPWILKILGWLGL